MFRRMRHVYLLIVLLILSGSGLIAPMRLAASVAVSRVNYLFTNPDGTPCQRPCLLGVQPRIMSFRRATQILRLHPLVEQVDESGCSRVSGFCTFRVRLFGASAAVTAMEGARGPDASVLVDDVYVAFERTLESPLLGDFIGALGTSMVLIPHYDCCGGTGFEAAVDKLMRFGPTYALTMYYPTQGIELTDFVGTRHTDHALTPYTAIKGIRAFQPYPICSRTKHYWDKWHGFISLAQLYAEPSQRCESQ